MSKVKLTSAEKISVAENKKRDKLIASENKRIEVLNEKTEVFAEIILSTSDLFHKSKSAGKTLIETTIGAAVWYLPISDILYSGKISKAALAELRLNKKAKLVAEHSIPRKVAANRLYTTYLEDIKIGGGAKIKQLYIEQMGRYNWVLKKENDSLKKYQKIEVFVDEETAYKLAGIELVDLSMEEYKLLKK